MCCQRQFGDVGDHYWPVEVLVQLVHCVFCVGPAVVDWQAVQLLEVLDHVVDCWVLVARVVFHVWVYEQHIYFGDGDCDFCCGCGLGLVGSDLLLWHAFGVRGGQQCEVEYDDDGQCDCDVCQFARMFVLVHVVADHQQVEHFDYEIGDQFDGQREQLVWRCNVCMMCDDQLFEDIQCDWDHAQEGVDVHGARESEVGFGECGGLL